MFLRQFLKEGTYVDLRRFFPTTCTFSIEKEQIWTKTVIVVSTSSSRVLTCSGGFAQLKADVCKVVASPSAILVGGLSSRKERIIPLQCLPRLLSPISLCPICYLPLSLRSQWETSLHSFYPFCQAKSPVRQSSAPQDVWVRKADLSLAIAICFCPSTPQS